MNKRFIIRQHESTSLDELAGQVCDKFLAVYNERTKRYSLFYLSLSGVFHRFYLDAGLLFWRSNEEPEPEDDLLDEDCYLDFGSRFQVTGVGVLSISMADCCLDIEFESGVRIRLKNDVQGVGAELIEFT